MAYMARYGISLRKMGERVKHRIAKRREKSAQLSIVYGVCGKIWHIAKQDGLATKWLVAKTRENLTHLSFKNEKSAQKGRLNRRFND